MTAVDLEYSDEEDRRTLSRDESTAEAFMIESGERRGQCEWWYQMPFG